MCWSTTTNTEDQFQISDPFSPIGAQLVEDISEEHHFMLDRTHILLDQKISFLLADWLLSYSRKEKVNIYKKLDFETFLLTQIKNGSS